MTRHIVAGLDFGPLVDMLAPVLPDLNIGDVKSVTVSPLGVTVLMYRRDEHGRFAVSPGGSRALTERRTFSMAEVFGVPIAEATS